MLEVAKKSEQPQFSADPTGTVGVACKEDERTIESTMDAPRHKQQANAFTSSIAE
jgi:hypothetical protein